MTDPADSRDMVLVPREERERSNRLWAAMSRLSAYRRADLPRDAFVDVVNADLLDLGRLTHEIPCPDVPLSASPARGEAANALGESASVGPDKATPSTSVDATPKVAQQAGGGTPHPSPGEGDVPVAPDGFSAEGRFFVTLDHLTRMTWRWGESCGIGNVGWDEKGDSYNEGCKADHLKAKRVVVDAFHAAVAEKVAQAHPAPATPAGWIVSNANGDRWRTWEDGSSAWTDDREKATRYARRDDAEAVHAEDEDAWRVEPYGPATPAGEELREKVRYLSACVAHYDGLNVPGLSGQVSVSVDALRTILSALQPQAEGGSR